MKGLHRLWLAFETGGNNDDKSCPHNTITQLMVLSALNDNDDKS